MRKNRMYEQNIFIHFGQRATFFEQLLHTGNCQVIQMMRNFSAVSHLNDIIRQKKYRVKLMLNLVI